MRRILFINNQGIDTWPSTINDLFSVNGFDLTYIDAKQGQLPKELSGYHGIFLSGSVLSAYDDLDWIRSEIDFITEAAVKNIPMLGSCFGSQILALALCGRDQVFRRSSCEVGYRWIYLNNSISDDPLLKNLDEKVEMFVWHNDEIKADHKDMVILGESSECLNHIWRFKGRYIWGIQGHPELNRDQVNEVLEKYRKYFVRDGADIEGLKGQVFTNNECKKLIQNFIDFCKESH